ncbi:flagellar basal-body rod protein FlgB [Poseidonocella pacifica]|uniref:Flagellar basal-body rod protein FlgB n=1 Tax=Poseidonocella pacifica TaxID=871651 RepID=A0A1I0XWM0_9RHOB|nr:FlgB family protein [Poseidonocella pacifica]SFB05465.1 flagellar basal-body rod protein FlgB [Poseidonocella pacifica]
MYDNLKIFHSANAMAAHAGTRQSVVSSNIANADTPEYKARKVAPFTLESGPSGSGFVARSTRARHLDSGSATRPVVITADDTPDSPNGNNVVIELEMLKGVEAREQHDRALTIYRHAMGVIRTSMGRG